MSFCSLFKNPLYTEDAQLIISITIGVVFAAFTYGGLFFILYIIAYELLMGFCNGWSGPYWTILGRTGVVYGSIFGFIIGRSLLGFDPLNPEPIPSTYIVVDKEKCKSQNR